MNKLPNTRGLGGLSAGSSAVIGHHELIRSGALHDATPHDVEYLTGTMGLKTIIDLRTDLEIAAKPDPAIPGAQWVHVPLLDTWEYEEIGLRTLTESGLEEMRNQGPEMMVRLYRKIVGAPEGIRGLKKFFQILLAQRSGSVLWHCTQGKDRTGVAAAILERILGCDAQVVEQDYLQTNPCLHMQEDQTEAWLTKKLHLSQKTARDFSFLFEARPEFLQAAWDMIDTEFGGFAAYLENQLGLDQEKQAQLKRMYTC
ncbi:tyrosine-protein phosphatase [Faecalibaculum rodentium]|uniref:tyrosine-protein phosphatase n=1 Tax=Faecalibaculum rodentium TaxID=1702221 RepID=UPI002570F569|nr:tyrosine-protein phosphatase [Faecalibaculum rodentium]